MNVKNLVLLTNSDLAKIVRWFDQRATRKSCPCCDESAVVIWPYPAGIKIPTIEKTISARMAVKAVLAIASKTITDCWRSKSKRVENKIWLCNKYGRSIKSEIAKNSVTKFPNPIFVGFELYPIFVSSTL